MFKKENKKESNSRGRKCLIGIGFGYILKDIFVAKAYFKQAGLPDEDIESITNSPELKELRGGDLTEREEKEKLRDFYRSLAENYKGEFQEGVREVAAKMLKNSKKET